jgi:hypothetical protein
MRTALTLALGLTLAVSAVTFAEEKAATPSKQPSPQEMMAKMMELGAPGPQHEKLKAMEGTFDAEVTMQMTPDAAPTTSKGKMTNQMVFGGRYLHGQYKGEFMGQPFEGMSVFGFDNMKKQYFNGWIDSMSTGVMMAYGSSDSAGKVITCTAKVDCPMDNSVKTMKTVVTITDNNAHTYEMYDVGADGKEFKTMTIKYTRAKEQSAAK